MTPGSSVFDIEAFFNTLVQRLFPVWYANQAVKELPLTDIGIINPNSHLSHRWLSLHSVVQAMQSSLENAGDNWQPLHTVLAKLISENDYQRPLSITAIQGVELGSEDEDWPSLLSYADHCCENIDWSSAEDFDRNLHQAFPDEEKPFSIVYREWDGRYYWLNKTEPVNFVAALKHAREKHRDASIQANINVESLHASALDALRSQYWLLLMNREDAYKVHDLINHTELSAILCEFEWRRSDLVVLTCRKNNKDLNSILLNLQNNRSSQQILDLGQYLSRHHHPFRNQ